MDEAVTQLAKLYHEHGPALLTYLRHRFDGVESAEDLLQETLLQAARRPGRLTEAVSPRAWLFAIARNVGLTALRRRKLTVALPAVVPVDQTRTDPRVEQMRAVIVQLPDHQREVLELRLRDELSYEEIAVVLKIPVGTVRSRLHHAVRRLREELTGWKPVPHKTYRPNLAKCSGRAPYRPS